MVAPPYCKFESRKKNFKASNKTLLANQTSEDGKKRYFEACFGCQINCETARAIADHWANKDPETKDLPPKYTFKDCPKAQDNFEKLRIKKRGRR